MRHIDLFSGIGGFAYAIDQVWDNVEHIFCDNNKFCQEVLKKHWKGSIIYGDIRQLTADTHRDRLQEPGAELKAGRDRQFSETTANPESGQSGVKEAGNGRKDTCGRSKEGIDILTGGFPCQPFSQAGKRRGTSDDRFLWPEMLRVIREFKPTWVVAENVRGLLTINEGVVFQQVCLDLEGEGYEVQPFIIPAVAVNAPHRRDRVWIVAYRASNRLSGQRPAAQDEEGYAPGSESTGQLARRPEGPHSNAPDTESQGRELRKRREKEGVFGCDAWNQNWLEVATELCGVDDGISYELDGLKLTKAGHRVERLKALGNSIVPQVAIEIFRAINEDLFTHKEERDD